MASAGGIYWEDHGGAGPPLLLSAGLGGSGHYWAPNIDALKACRRVLSYDHRGTGRSERTVEGDLTVEAMGEDIRLVLDAAGVETATIVGHAAGGLAGLALALAAPERVAALVIVNGWAKLDPHTARCFDTRLALLRESPRAFYHAQPLFLYPPQWNSEHHQQLVEEEEAHLAAFPGAEMMQRRIAAVRRFNVEKRLKDVAVPVLCISCDDDMLVPAACSTVLAKAIPEAGRVRMRYGGHACNVTRPKEFNDWLLAWLDREG
ncbi:pyrimidine utilization protein D [Sphingomonas sp.]|uniref:pyrimidine utilization protein D n=1 Tax=Sphingomonas sp. TaxID=28214 RepID=UPI001B1A5BE3|nr:pyrimidine utilization protein D [Sphingomonas sp.]MBO9712106.1 pyrimidine utilization protein D [Sphingomonas sp.]